jgi:hypothetical protein
MCSEIFRKKFIGNYSGLAEATIVKVEQARRLYQNILWLVSWNDHIRFSQKVSGYAWFRINKTLNSKQPKSSIVETSSTLLKKILEHYDEQKFCHIFRIVSNKTCYLSWIHVLLICVKKIRYY